MKPKMLKVTVKTEFIDRYTGVTHKPGETLEVTDARYREIQRSGDYVEVEKAKPKNKE